MIDTSQLDKVISNLIEYLIKSAPVALLIMITSAVKAKIMYHHLPVWEQVVLSITSFVAGMSFYHIMGDDPKWGIGIAIAWDKLITIIFQIIQDKKLSKQIKDALVMWVKLIFKIK